MRIAGQNAWLTDAKYKQPGFKVSGSGCWRRIWRSCSLSTIGILLAARSSIHELAAHCQQRICIPSAAAPSLNRKQALHVPDFDFKTNCILLTDCLAEVKRWSGAVQRGPQLAAAAEAINDPHLSSGSPRWMGVHGLQCAHLHRRAPHRGTAAPAADANPRHLPLRVYIEVKESGQLQVGVGGWACS